MASSNAEDVFIIANLNFVVPGRRGDHTDRPLCPSDVTPTVVPSSTCPRGPVQQISHLFVYLMIHDKST